MIEPSIPVAKEGYPFVAVSALATLVTAMTGYGFAAFPLLGLTIFILYFFRDPERVACEDIDALVSPADGRVILIEKVFDDQYVKEHVYKICIFMNIFNVHVNRMPFPGQVTKVVYSPGRFYAANSERSSLENESCAVMLETAGGRRMAVVQIAGLIARRIVCWVRRGDKVDKGQRFGLIRFGSRVDLYLPLKTQLEITQGQKVRAGETILGYLP